MAINLASFNICTFSSSEDRMFQKDLSKIAAIIKQSNADVVALQEVIDQKSITDLLFQLCRTCAGTHEWKGCFKKEKTHRNNREGYAVLWNERSVSLAKDDEGVDVEPEIMTRYTSLKRPPMVARFRVHKLGELGCEVCIINTHIIFNEDKYLHAKEHKNWYGAGAMRALEYSKIVKDIYPSYSNHLSTYAVIAGDYNLSGSMLALVNAAGNAKGDRLQMLSVQNEKSTIKVVDAQAHEPFANAEVESPKAEQGFFAGIYNGVLSLFGKGEQPDHVFPRGGESAMSGDAVLTDGDYVNDYDHFSFDLSRVAPYVKNARRINIPESLFPLPQHRFHAYKADVSDHVPVVTALDVKSSST